MEKCTCTTNKVRPNETCLFCCHKHLAAALALTNNSLIDDTLLLRIASQIQLAAWHFNKNYLNFVERCQKIIKKVLFFEEFKSELIKLVEDTWDLYSKNKNIKYQYYNIDISKLENINQNYLNGMLCVSNAIELFSYENTYQDINLSYVIGQLVLAAWCFQKEYKNYALKTRIIYNKINLNNFDINELEEFKNILWKKYKKNFNSKTILSACKNFE